MDHTQIRKLVEKIEAKIKLFQEDETAQLYGLNEYDAIEAVLREELGDK